MRNTLKYQIFIFLFCLYSVSMAHATETPLAALTAIQQAIDTNDHDLFERHVDVSGIISRGVDAFTDELAATTPAGQTNPMLDMLSGGLGTGDDASGISPSMKELLADTTYMFVIRGVSAGDFSGHPSSRSDLPDGGILSALFADASRARKELRNVRVLSATGDSATASASVYDYGSERSYPVRVSLTKQASGDWRVMNVDNMRELIHRILRENQ